MKQLAFDDTQKLHQGIQNLYTLHQFDTFGVDALSIVNRLVSSDFPVFHTTNMRTHQIVDTVLPGFPCLTPEMQRIKSRYLVEHPLFEHMSEALNGVCKISDFVTQSQLHSLAGIYQQFLRPMGSEDQMTVFIANPQPSSWNKFGKVDLILFGFAFSRTQRNFTERDRSILNLLRPHLAQAYCNAQQHHQLQQEHSNMQQSLDRLGVAIVDAQGRVESIAPQAIIWLEIYFPKPINVDRLPDHLWAWIEHQIVGLTPNSNLPKAILPLRIQQVGRELKIRLVVEEIGVRYLLLLEEQTLSSLNSLELLGLSQRETEVLALVIQGKNNKAIALQLSVHQSTIRKHLENIYRKLGVSSRTEAIAQALGKLGFLRSLPLR
ncbi:helix-turn-helix transcriptional regulator [Chamaesiphon sp. VAR_48_metabat_135_sub]|uniref:helix-turn-helix domain-containing protein n=1 Tax=Chamaesiphon sp. VAR_48_metabat_135_sub TaxID=2964699 RepID=UPI00286BB189|nr:helix-turn-helix transcriptional regulator [Chamaesiphon sp. VAR_48_metabat_135_sub]